MGKFYGVNRVQLMGNLGADPELRFTQAGKPVCNLRIAVSEPPFSDGKEDITSWHDVVVWGKPGEEAAKLRSGATVMVFGRISTRSFEGNDGKKQYRTEVVADAVGQPMFGGEGRGARDDGDAREPDNGGGGRNDHNGQRDNRGGGNGGYRQNDRAPAQNGGRDNRGGNGRPPPAPRGNGRDFS